VLIGIPTFRLRGHYFALSMLAYPLAMLYVFEWLGYQEVSLPMKRENPIAYMQFTDQRTYMVISMIVVVACMIISLHVERSRFGRSLLAIKQNQPAAEAAGINAMRWKMFAMISIVSFRLHGTPAQVAGIMIAFMLPMAFVSPPAGVFVDRWAVKPTMITSDLIRAVLIRQATYRKTRSPRRRLS